MAIPTVESSATPLDEHERRAAIQRRLAQLNGEAPGTIASAAAPRPALGGQPSVLDQSQRAGERAPFQASGSQLEEMQRSIADTATRNAAPYVGGGSPNTGAPGGLAGPSRVQGDTLGDAVSRRLSASAPDKNDPLGLGLGSTPASLGATGSAAVQRATGTAPLDRETQQRLGSAPSDEVQTLLGAKTAPIPTSLPGLRATTPTPIDQAQRVGERSTAPAYDFEALKAEAARLAAEANARNSGTTTTGTTTTTGSVVRPPQPPTQPPTTETFPPPDDRSTTDLWTKMFQGQGDQSTLGDAPPPPGGAGGPGGVSLPGAPGAPGGPMTSAQLQQSLSADLGEISRIIAAGANAPDMLAIFATQGRTVLAMLDEQIREMQSEGETIDPATQNMLSVMREELGRQLKESLEGLNRRGIAESGIAVEAEAIMRRGNLSDQARLLAERLSRIQSNIQSLRGQKATEASRFGLAGASAQANAEESELDRIEKLRGLRQQGRTTLLNNQTGIEEAQRSRDFEAEQNQLQRQSVMAQKMADLAANANDRAAERQWKSKQADLDRQLKASLDAQVTARGRGSAGSRGSTTANGATPGDNTADAIEDMYATFATRREAEAALRDPAILRDLQENGVDIGKVIAAAQGLGERRTGLEDY